MLITELVLKSSKVLSLDILLTTASLHEAPMVPGVCMTWSLRPALSGAPWTWDYNILQLCYILTRNLLNTFNNFKACVVLQQPRQHATAVRSYFWWASTLLQQRNQRRCSSKTLQNWGSSSQTSQDHWTIGRTTWPRALVLTSYNELGPLTIRDPRIESMSVAVVLICEGIQSICRFISE